MALSFLQATSSTTDLTEYTFSAQSLGTATSDRYIVVTVGGRKTGATTTISSVTVGGVAATIAKQQSNTVTNTCVSGIAIAAVPTGATGDIVVTFGAGMLRCGIGVYRVDHLLSATAHDTDSSVAADPSVTLDVPTGFSIGTAITGASTMAAWTGLTEDHDTAIESATTVTSASKTFRSYELARTMTADFTSSTESAGCFASWSLTDLASKTATRGLSLSSLNLSRL